jgi:transcriptional regulator with XRE-family HTH domain
MKPSEMGEIIKDRRQLLGVDQQSLAQLSGVSVHTLSNIESGKGNPSLTVLLRILDALGMELKVGIKSLA